MRHLLMVIIICTGMNATAFAGPPFRTDDPEPVEYRHWEIYLVSQGSFGHDGTTITAPHLEINYGIYPNVQVHIITPFMYVKPKASSAHYGYSDTELGVKFRFIQETELHPQVGIFPIVLLPTGDKDRALGSGEVDGFLPVWLQKSWGDWKTYGGGGYWINPGSVNKDYWFWGWEIERTISEYFTVGTEVFHQTASEVGKESSTGFNIGTIININDLHHVLLSSGKNTSGPKNISFYLSYQLTFGQ